MEWKCERCGKEFDGYVRNYGKPPKYCSTECYHAARKGYPRRSYGPNRPPETKRCPACRKSFVVGGAGRPLRRTRFCSVTCAGRAAHRPGATAQELKPLDAAYLAGLIDGEGSIMLHRRADSGNMHVILTVSNTNRELLDWIGKVTGVGRIMNRAPASERHKPGMFWRATAEAAATVLAQIQPHLIVKRERCKLGLATQARIRQLKYRVDRSWHDEWRKRMQGLNARGPRLFDTT